MKFKTTEERLKFVYENSLELLEQRKSVSKSYGEQIIADYLTKNNIAFISEHWFADCYNKASNHLLFFDFYIPSLKICIEFQGPHHYPPILTNAQKTRDAIKVKYCKRNKIKLLAVHYMEAKKFAQIFKFFVKRPRHKKTSKAAYNVYNQLTKAEKKIQERYEILRSAASKPFNMISEERHKEIIANKKALAKKNKGAMRHIDFKFQY